MKFTVYPHRVSYYMTQVDDDVVEFIPVEDFTLIKVNDKTYSLPYGLKGYKALVQAKKEDQLEDVLSQVITGIGNSKYEIDTDRVLTQLNLDDGEGDLYVLKRTLLNQLKSVHQHWSLTQYKETLKNLIDLGNLVVDNQYLEELSHLGRVLNTDITERVYPCFSELLDQLDNTGFLDEVRDPKLMMKNYNGD